MNKKKFQRVISLVLALLCVFSSATVLASAEGENVLLISPAPTSKPTTIQNSSVTDATIDDVKEILNSMSYDEYFKKYSRYASEGEAGDNGTNRVWSVPVATEEIIVDAVSAVNAEMSDAAYAVGNFDGVEALYTPADGTVSWNVAIPETARYSVIIEYYPTLYDVDGNTVAKSTAIERIFRINSTIPFLEARYLTLQKEYINQYVSAVYTLKKGETAEYHLDKAAELGIMAVSETVDGVTYIKYDIPEVWTEARYEYLCEELEVRFFTTDIDLNEIRSAIVQSPRWMTYEIHDTDGYYSESFEFVFEKSENTVISLTGVSEPLVIKTIKLVPHEFNIPYADASSYYQNAAAGTSKVKLEGEYVATTTSQTIYPVEDTRSAITSPIATSHTMLNSIGGVGGDKWQTAGQALAWKFSVDNSGVYNIVARFSQSALDGMYASRSLAIYTNYTEEEYKAAFGDLDGYYNGIPFAEATKLRFDYDSKWQSKILSDGITDFEFYFREGVEYKVELTVTLGSMGDLVSQIENSLEAINADYLSILKLTGADPDDYRDYGFKRVMPDVVDDLIDQSILIYDISAQLQAMAGIKGSMVATLDKVAWLLDRMGGDPENEIAKNLTQLKSYIGSLGTWISDAKTQPLQIDYLLVQGKGSELPRAEAGFFQAFAHEMGSFFQSFFRNYDRMGATEDYDSKDPEIVKVWLAYGRDQTQVIRNLINNDFTPQYGTAVDLKLVAGGTLLPSILSKTGPDVYIGLGQSDVINYAIRGALMPIEDCAGFDALVLDPETREFNDAAMMVLGIEDATGEMHYYGLPETQNFNMMFVRKDILAELDLDIPKTWDDIYSAIPVLQANNMQIGMHVEYRMFIYQMGADLFADNGMRINLDSNTSLEAFEKMCNMFTMYSFPLTYDFSNRFRTGEMPIGFAMYTDTYNKLKVFATEIEGLWGFYPMPGMEDEYGNINNCSVSGVSAIVMITGCKNVDGAWDFMRWHSGADCQEKYSNEMVSILGPSAKHPTANLKALASLPWTTDEIKQIQLQFNNLASIPNYPGSYIIERYAKFAYMAAINDDADPVEELLKYINTINKEITRKRAEFDLETLDYIGQKLSEKRLAQAYTLLSEGELIIQKGVYEEVRGEQEIVMKDIEFTLSKTVRANAVIDELIENIGKAADVDDRMSEENQMVIIVDAIAKLEGVLAATADSADKTGIEKAIELLNGAYDALVSYQE